MPQNKKSAKLPAIPTTGKGSLRFTNLAKAQSAAASMKGE
jgi:hypothetical protein